MTKQRTILYLSHGGGPLPLLGDPSHAEMVETLSHIATKLTRPKAVIVISAHWEQSQVSVTSGAAPELIYDYSGFPPESYQITYPAVGEPALAQAVYSNLTQHGIKAVLNDHRGFDHGLFVPLKILFPGADIPCIQISLLSNLNPEAHLELGKAIAQLDYNDLLIVGSGFSFHNMRAFFSPVTPESRAMNESFEAWLIDTCSNSSISEPEREQRLINWEKAPSGRYCHPREEHLLPLHVCYGISQRPCDEVFEFKIMNRKSSNYLWQINC